jgi:hypothetical protein
MSCNCLQSMTFSCIWGFIALNEVTRMTVYSVPGGIISLVCGLEG